MDLSPWQRINPCGLGVAMTQLVDLVDVPPTIEQVMDKLADYLCAGLGYNAFLSGDSDALLHELR